jgi:hypothetical protein
MFSVLDVEPQQSYKAVVIEDNQKLSSKRLLLGLTMLGLSSS